MGTIYRILSQNNFLKLLSVNINKIILDDFNINLSLNDSDIFEKRIS